MKIGEARQIYGAQLKAYQQKKLSLAKQRQSLQEKMDAAQNGKELYAKEAAVLELTYHAVNDKQKEYQWYMNQLSEQWAATANMVSAEQQGDAMAEYAADMGKIMEVARRIMKGAIVPASDEKKLMEFSMELYQAAKNIGMLARREEKEEYDSLWGDEEEKEYEDPIEAADHAEAFGEGPQIVDVEATMAAAVSEGNAV